MDFDPAVHRDAMANQRHLSFVLMILGCLWLCLGSAAIATEIEVECGFDSVKNAYICRESGAICEIHDKYCMEFQAARVAVAFGADDRSRRHDALQRRGALRGLMMARGCWKEEFTDFLVTAFPPSAACEDWGERTPPPETASCIQERGTTPPDLDSQPGGEFLECKAKSIRQPRGTYISCDTDRYSEHYAECRLERRGGTNNRIPEEWILTEPHWTNDWHTEYSVRFLPEKSKSKKKGKGNASQAVDVKREEGEVAQKHVVLSTDSVEQEQRPVRPDTPVGTTRYVPEVISGQAERTQPSGASEQANDSGEARALPSSGGTLRAEGRYVPEPDTARGIGATVKDNRTGLIWQREAAPRKALEGGQIDCSSCQVRTDRKYNWADAGTYCKKLKLGGFGGWFSSWRLPTRDELKDAAQNAPSAVFVEPSGESSAADVFQRQEFWSSDAYWGVSFHDGDARSEAPQVALYVRCVH